MKIISGQTPPGTRTPWARGNPLRLRRSSRCDSLKLLSALAHLTQSAFAHRIQTGLSVTRKHIHASALFDEVGWLLFKAVESLPAYGMPRAEQRILRRYQAELARRIDPASMRPKISRVDLTAGPGGEPHVNSWLNEARAAVAKRAGRQPLLLSVPRGLMGILDRAERNAFLLHLRSVLTRGDFLLFGADLVKESVNTLSAYNDPLGVFAAFNKNLLLRINRELGGHFDVWAFAHQPKWDAFLRRVELHLVALRNQDVYVAVLGRRFHFAAGETIHTGSFYRSCELELEELAAASGFQQLKSWTDLEWSFAEVLWRV